ncbi:hypothetical protein AVEN_219786-1 [Araneus ventricosus]|uniref:Uncharacterized protein n=1 Tax=Araneus ventricosus TaxID=182803 RepID=A0A4Y2JYX9_ARAVE|nr:hypothetical protein AVEN_219786-1 [Araneus ventricosus]
MPPSKDVRQVISDTFSKHLPRMSEENRNRTGGTCAVLICLSLYYFNSLIASPTVCSANVLSDTVNMRVCTEPKARHSRLLHSTQMTFYAFHFSAHTAIGTPILYYPSPAFQTRNPACCYFLWRESLIPTYLHRSHFSIYGPAVQMERLDIQTDWKSKLSTAPLQFSPVFCNDN